MSAARLALASHDAGHHESIHRAGHSYVEQPARFLDLRPRRRPVRVGADELPIFDADDVHVRELESIRRVEGQQIDALLGRLRFCRA